MSRNYIGRADSKINGHDKSSGNEEVRSILDRLRKKSSSHEKVPLEPGEAVGVADRRATPAVSSAPAREPAAHVTASPEPAAPPASDEAPKKRKTKNPPTKKLGAGLRPEPNPKWAEENNDGEPFMIAESIVIRCPGLSCEAKAIYYYLCDHAHNYKTDAFPGLASITACMSMCRTTAIKYLDELEAWGFIRREQPGFKKNNIYTLIYRKKPKQP